MTLAVTAALITHKPCVARMIAATAVQWLDVGVDTRAITIERADQTVA